MKSILVPAVLAALLSGAQAQLVGYGAGTTGGGNSTPVVVSDCSAFKSAVASNTAKVVHVNGIISGCNRASIGSNTSVQGLGSSSGFTGGGLLVDKKNNIIIRNLKIGPPAGGGDGLTVQYSTNVWIDHNEFFSDGPNSENYDGALDITHGSDLITVSWNYLRDHNKNSLVGHADDNSAEDRGKLKVTYHHNWFRNVNQRLPSLRFGTGHIYNNYYQTCTQSGINQRMGAEVLAENNYFDNCKKAMMNNQDSANSGNLCNKGNTLANGSTTDLSRTGCSYTPPYSYSAESASSARTSVQNGAGVGKAAGGPQNVEPFP